MLPDLPRPGHDRRRTSSPTWTRTTRRKAYECDITYGTNSEFGFDYLRDNMKPARWGDADYPTRTTSRCQRALNYAIIDEVDNILIDEARTPLIISGPAFTTSTATPRPTRSPSQLTDLQKKGAGRTSRSRRRSTPAT